MNTTQKLFYGAVASLATIHSVAAQAGASSVDSQYGLNKVNASKIGGSQERADEAVQTLVKNATTFLYLVAVGYALYGGYLILTAGTDDGKISEGKKAILHALLGVLVIFLASSIVRWFIGAILGGQ